VTIGSAKPPAAATASISAEIPAPPVGSRPERHMTVDFGVILLDCTRATGYAHDGRDTGKIGYRAGRKRSGSLHLEHVIEFKDIIEQDTF
jgi:hypothetical protein